jgi:hypothetical protein
MNLIIGHGLNVTPVEMWFVKIVNVSTKMNYIVLVAIKE